MRSFELHGGGVDGLKQVQRADPTPGPGQVLVRIRATSLNYRDLMVAEQVHRTLVPLSDGAGEVVGVGPAVTAVRAGDRVAGAFFQSWIDGPFDPEMRRSALGGGRDGVLSELAVLEQHGVVRLPDSMPFEDAATLPCAGVTAWVGLMKRGGLRAGETVLAMGTGGVSLFALQLAKLAGARVLLTSSDDAKLARGKALGADDVINYRTMPRWDIRARELTGGRGVDHILEVGGTSTMSLSLGATRDGGHISIVGLLSGGWPDADAAARNDRGIRVDTVHVGSVRHLEELIAAMIAARLSPVVDRVFSFDDAPEAYAYLRSGRHFGKIVVRGP